MTRLGGLASVLFWDSKMPRLDTAEKHLYTGLMNGQTKNQPTGTKYQVWKLLAKDSVIIHGRDNSSPRDVSSMFFAPSSRADVAVHCPG